MSRAKVLAILALAVIGSLAAFMLLEDTISESSFFIKSFRGSTNKTEEDLIRAVYQEWKKNNTRLYARGEDKKRFLTFSGNYKLIENHNKKNLSWTLGLNHFADQTDEEFFALNLGFDAKGNLNYSDKNVSYFNQTNLGCSDHVDWRGPHAVTGVKNQGNCGSCWSFSAAGAMEGIYALKSKHLVDLSEQQLVDCSGSYGNHGCGGGMMNAAFAYARDHGIQSEGSYHYHASQGRCSYNPKAVVFRLKGFSNVPARNPGALGNAICHQPVAVGVQADPPAFRFYKGGIIGGGCGTSINHGIVATGYGPGYWHVKNSWGGGWGEGGYARIAAGMHNSGGGICGINLAASVPVL